MPTTSEMSQMTIFDSLGESEDQYNLSQGDFRAKLFLLLENVKDSETLLEVLYFLKSSASHLCSDPSIYSWKMLQDFLAMKKEEPSQLSSIQWQNWGTMQSGKCIIQARMSLKTVSESSLSDILEEQVDEKYFLSAEKTETLLKSLENSKETTTKTAESTVGGVAPTLSTGGQEPKIMVVGSTKPKHCTRSGQRDIVYDSRGIMGALSATDYKQPKQILVNEHIPCLTPDREEKRQNGRRFKEPGEPMFTLTAQDRHGIYDGYRVRKLTPLECFRLQSYPDEWYYKLREAGISDSQLYKMAGNGVTSVVAYEIGKRLPV